MRGRRSLFRLWGVLTLWLKEARSPTAKHIRTYAALFASTKTRRVTSALIPVVFALAVIGLVQFYNRPEEIVVASHGCPGTTTITVNTTWSTNQCLGDVTIRNGATLTINGGITADLASLSVGSDSPAENGFITAKGDTATGEGVTINVDGDVYVRAASSISADSQGYLGGALSSSGTGPGAGSTGTVGGGAGHGGAGDPGESGGGAAGAAYGSYDDPVQLGSGGGGASTGTGGNGGGAIALSVGGTTTVNGTISANGGNGGNACCGQGGAGSGGSIKITADVLAGSGTVRANGGIGGCGSFGCQTGGSGAGGRIRITYASSTATITTQAYGGIGDNPQSRRGGAGTIYTPAQFKVVNDPAVSTITSPTTSVDGGVITTDQVLIGTRATVAFGDSIEVDASSTTIQNNALVTLGDGVDFAAGTTLIESTSSVTLQNSNTLLSGGDLTIQTGTNSFSVNKDIASVPEFEDITIGTGTLQHAAHTSTHVYSLLLKATGNVSVTGTINVDGRGLAGGTSGSINGEGTGAGVGNASGCGGGAAYGGNGGTGSSQSGAPGTAYGSISQPTNLGSGGGRSGGGPCTADNGAAGGGVVRIDGSNGTFTISGTISANGAGTSFGGGGSGGSIWLSANSLAGSGTVTANGSTPGGGGSKGGGGGGGRVVIDYVSSSASLTTRAFGGSTGTIRGGAGTVELGSELIIANDSASTTLSPTTPLTDASYSYGTLTIKDASRVSVANNTSLEGGVTTLQNNIMLSLLGASTVWSGSSLAISTGTNTLSIPPSITTKPYFTGNITLSSGTLWHDTHTTTHTSSLILTAGGNITLDSAINVNGRGFSGGASTQTGNGDGPGVGSVSTHAGGGAHGGNGGNASSGGATGGVAYGSATAPRTLGSGGGGGNGTAGGNGGGAVELRAGGTLTINAAITANGTDGVNSTFDSGGGAGGSIFLAGNVIAGTAALNANGGNGASGGCGAGGRIARHYSSSTYSGTVTVTKGTGSCSVGQDGTNQTVGAVTDLVVTGISSPRTAGVTSSVVVEARDGSNNRNYAYTKAVTFTSTDAQATLPGNYTFTVTDAGQATIPGVILKTAGTQTVTVDQTDDGTVDGTHANITVNPAAAATLAVAGLTSPVSAGTSGTVVVTARDQYANVATGYTGTVAFSSSDAAASLPVNYVFTLGDAGTKTFTDNVTFKTVGVHSVTVTDTVTSSITGLQSNIAVTHGPVTKFTVTANPASIQSGGVVSLTATAYDAYNNVGTGYAGTVAVNSSDLTATLPANSTFTLANSGVKTITGLVLRGAGTQTATVFQVGAQAIQGVSGPITVVAASSSGNNGAGNGNSGSTGSSGGQNNAVKKITFEVTINPEGNGNFTGNINQEVEGAVLNVTVSGVVTGGQVIGYVQGTYGNVPVSGVLSGTVENNAIGSATITLFSTANKSFIKRVVLGGAVQRSERDPAPCQIRGTITTIVDSQPFTGEVRLTINDDGSLEGTAKGKLGKRTVSGTFYAPEYSAEVIEGSLTIVRQNNTFAETVAVVGSLDPGEIQVLEAKNCRIKAEIDFEAPPVPGTTEETDPTPGSGEVVIVVGDPPISGSSEQEVPVVGEVQTTNTSTETEPAVGTLDVQVNGIILQPTEVSFTSNTNALEALAVALVVVGATTTIPLIPQVQTGLMTSSIRGTSILNWVFFGRTPSRRRRWGVIRDAVTGVPVAGVQVLLVDVRSNEILKQMRTDRTGRFGFVLGQSAPVERYRLVINDPMYEGYTTEEFDNGN